MNFAFASLMISPHLALADISPALKVQRMSASSASWSNTAGLLPKRFGHSVLALFKKAFPSSLIHTSTQLPAYPTLFPASRLNRRQGQLLPIRCVEGVEWRGSFSTRFEFPHPCIRLADIRAGAHKLWRVGFPSRSQSPLPPLCSSHYAPERVATILPGER